MYAPPTRPSAPMSTISPAYERASGVKHITTPFITIRAIKAYTRFSLSRSPSHPMAIRDTADMIPRSEMSHDA